MPWRTEKTALRRSFVRDLEKIRDQSLRRSVSEAIVHVEAAETLMRRSLMFRCC